MLGVHPRSAALLGIFLLSLGAGCAQTERNKGEPASHDAESPGQAAIEAERLAQLSALGYVGVVRKDLGEFTGLVAHDPARASGGITGLGQRHGPSAAHFYDETGNAIYALVVRPSSGGSMLWAEPTRDGNLIVSGRGYLLKVDWEGNTVWEAPRRTYHHGFAQGQDGRIYAMAQVRRRVRVGLRKLPMLDDSIVVLEPDGTLEREISILDLLGKDRIPDSLTRVIRRAEDGDKPTKSFLNEELGVDNPYDVFHLNSVQVLHTEVGDARPGDLLISLRTLDLVLAIAADGSGVLWEWEEGTKIVERQHSPVQLENGNLLVFDNGWFRGWSRLVEWDPRTKQIAWEYRGSPPKSFFTRRGGIAQPLPSGNVMVTQSDVGRVFEVTRAGEIVWDFWNPRRKGGKRLTAYRAWRWTPEQLVGAVGLPQKVSAVLRPAGAS